MQFSSDNGATSRDTGIIIIHIIRPMSPSEAEVCYNRGYNTISFVINHKNIYPCHPWRFTCQC